MKFERDSVLSYWTAASVLIGLYSCVAIAFIYSGRSNADEGFYLAVSARAAEGFIPYKDFAYTQTPLLPFIQGAILRFLGFGIQQQRWLSVLASIASVIVISVILRKERVAIVGMVVALGSCAISLPVIYFLSIGKTYALAQLLLIFAAAGLYAGGPLKQLIWVSVFAAAAVGCRLTVAPAATVLLIAVVLLNRKHLHRTSCVGVPFIAALAVFGPVVLADVENAYFWMWDFHQHVRIGPRRWLVLKELFQYSPAVCVLPPVALAIMVGRRYIFSRPDWLICAGGSAIIANIIVAGTYAEYLVPFIPLTVLGAVLVIFSEQVQPFYHKVLLTLALAPVLFTWEIVLPLIQYGYCAASAAAAKFIKEDVAVDGRILSSMPELAVQAGRLPWPRNEMGKFGITSEMPQGLATRRNMLTHAELSQSLLSGEPAAVVLSNEGANWNFMWSLPSVTLMPLDVYNSSVDFPLRANYYCAYTDAFYIIFLPRMPRPPAPRPSVQ